MDKIIPPGITFKQAIVFGYTGKIECPGYTRWLKTQRCATCGRVATTEEPNDPSHLNSTKGMGAKAIDLFCIPQCRRCHDRYEVEPLWISPAEFLEMAIYYLAQAFYERRLRWHAV